MHALTTAELLFEACNLLFLGVPAGHSFQMHALKTAELVFEAPTGAPTKIAVKIARAIRCNVASAYLAVSWLDRESNYQVRMPMAPRKSKFCEAFRAIHILIQAGELIMLTGSGCCALRSDRSMPSAVQHQRRCPLFCRNSGSCRRIQR